MSDELLPAYVKNIPVDDGVSPNGRDFYHYYSYGEEFSVNMNSLPKETYQYFLALVDQFNNMAEPMNQHRLLLPLISAIEGLASFELQQ